MIVIQGMVEIHELSSFRLTPDSDDEGLPMIILVVLVPEADPGGF